MNLNFVIVKHLEDLIEGFNEEIIECSDYLIERKDVGKTHREDDPCETISFTRGKMVGLVISRDRLTKVLNNFKSDIIDGD